MPARLAGEQTKQGLISFHLRGQSAVAVRYGLDGYAPVPAPGEVHCLVYGHEVLCIAPTFAGADFELHFHACYLDPSVKKHARG
jgi:hypothetical protein